MQIQTSGEFQVAAPYLEEQWGSTDQHWGPEDKGIYTLKMSPSPGTGRHLWMWFDFGVYSGVMRSTGPPPTTLGTPCAFLWRGKESGEGEMDFSDLNKGTITFLEGGKIRGTISGDLLGKNREFADVQIDSKVTVWTKEVRSWKREYRAINERAHYVSGLTRWGGWASEEGCTDDPVGSDTTDAGGQDDERHTDDEEYGDDGLGGDYGSHVEYDFDPYKVEPR